MMIIGTLNKEKATVLPNNQWLACPSCSRPNTRTQFSGYYGFTFPQIMLPNYSQTVWCCIPIIIPLPVSKKSWNNQFYRILVRDTSPMKGICNNILSDDWF